MMDASAFGRLSCVLLAAAVAGGVGGCSRDNLRTSAARTSYAVGLDIGAGMRTMGARLDVSSLAQGISDTMYGQALLVPADSLEPLRRRFARLAFERRNDSADALRGEQGPGRITLVMRRGLDTEVERMCYAVGVDIGSRLCGIDLHLDLTALAQGIADTVYGQRVRIKPKECAKLLAEFSDTIVARRARAENARAQTMAAESEKFLRENAGRPGVRTTRSGLQYEVLKHGRGRRPGPGSRIRVHYTIRLVSGIEVETTRELVEPAIWAVSGITEGLSEGVQLMSPGAVYRFFVPPRLAYGGHARGKIPPNAVLVADVELMEIIE